MNKPIIYIAICSILIQAMTAVQAATNNPDTVSVVSEPEQNWRHNQPGAEPPTVLHLPSIETYKLSNGLTVELVCDHRVPFTTAALGFKFGSTSDPASLHGLASMTAAMMLEGAAGKSSREIANETDFIGGALRSSSDYDFTILSGSALSKYNDRLLRLISDVLPQPSFPEDELKLKKTNEIQEIKLKRSDPDFLTEERFAKVVFGNHPYSVVEPTPATIEKITRKDLQSFYTHNYLPNQAVLIVVGDFNDQSIRSTINADFGQQKWKASSISTVRLPSPPAVVDKRIYIVDRPDSVQSSIMIGNIALAKTDPDYFPLLVANQILGGGAQARLFLNLRENKGFTYGAYSQVIPRLQQGSIEASANVRTEVTSPAIQEFLYELEKIRNVKATGGELSNAKNYINGSFELGLETQAGLAQRLLDIQLYGLPSDYLQTYTVKVDKVNADDVRHAAQKWIDLNHQTIVVVGNAGTIAKDLEYYAPVEIFNTQGSRQTKTSVAASKSQ